MEDTIVLYPCLPRGHLVAMVELANHLLNQNPSFSITIIVTISDVAELSTNSSITFYQLPPITLTKTYSFPAHLPNLFYDLAESSNPNLHEALTNISKTSIVKALVIDFFNTAAFQVSSELNIPTYYFFTSGACGLAVFLYLTTIHKNTTSSLKDLVDFHIDVPGLPHVPSSAMPIALMDRTTELYDCFIKTSTYLAKCDGVVVNSFEYLEKKALDAIRKGDCTLAGEKPPPVYCIGPVLENAKDEHDYIIKWLDSQPSQSVLFLCFGSMGVFSSKQLSEMAVALETSNIRFLWVVRQPPEEGTKSDPESFLPEGFLSRTKNKGLVVKNWAPQVKVLSHDSVGGFVTHCGWNSILEGVRAGVPMLAWPLYAEQKMNRVFLVNAMKVALWVAESEEDGLVSASELEQRVAELFQSEKGKEVRERVMVMRDEAAVAIKDGGSSDIALKKLIESLERVGRFYLTESVTLNSLTYYWCDAKDRC